MDENKVAENVDGGNNVLQHSGSCSVTGPFITFGDIVTTSFITVCIFVGVENGYDEVNVQNLRRRKT